MHSMNFFNVSYFKQNLKKSKVTLSFMLLILPILTFIILFMVGTGSNISILSLNDISSLAIFGMYILPIAISLSLFGFVFKKKSVDFMGSMPLNRKTIFFTNTIGGILIFLFLLFITTLLMGFATILLPNLYIPVDALLDFFILSFISYLFVFTACNIAVGLSGNAVTTIVVTMLIIFFVPFHHYVFSEIHWNNQYAPIYYDSGNNYQECEDEDTDCLEKTGYFSTFTPVKETSSYTMPFGIFVHSFDDIDDSVMYQNDVIGKMVLLSILYIFVGYLLFERKEMEVCETSFKKFWVHQLVKILTLIPIFIIVSIPLETADAITWILVAAIILVYNFIYDLITKRSIQHVFVNFACFALTFIVVTFTMISFLRDGHMQEGKEFTRNDIEKVEIDISNLSAVDGTWIPLEDEQLITKITDFLVPTDTDLTTPVHVMFTVDGKQYKEYVYMDKSTSEEIISSLKKTKEYQAVRFENMVDKSNVITIGHDYLTLDKEGKELLKRSLKNDESTAMGFYIPIDIYCYQNHQMKSYTVFSNINENLQKYIVELYNSKVRSVSFDKNIHLNFRNQGSIDEYAVLDSRNNMQLLQIILNHKTVDFSKPIYQVDIYTNQNANQKTFSYYTNIHEDMLPFLRMMNTEDNTYVD